MMFLIATCEDLGVICMCLFEVFGALKCLICIKIEISLILVVLKLVKLKQITVGEISIHELNLALLVSCNLIHAPFIVIQFKC